MMKTRLFYLPAILFVACQSRPESATQPPDAGRPPLADAKAAPTAASRLSPILSGYWLSTSYLQKLAQTRSPAQAFGYTPPGPASLYIEPFATNTDSVQIGASYGMHEGGDLVLLLQAVQADHTVPLKAQYGVPKDSAGQLVYHISATDTTLFYTQKQAKGKQLTRKIAYRRVRPAGVKTDLEGGVNWAVNQLLMAAQYQGKDSLQQAVTAQFFADGTVKGLPFKKYVVQTDFTGPNAGDEVIFDVYTKASISLAASFGRDTLRLYSIHSSLEVPAGATDTTEVFRKGRLRYELVRKR